MVYITGDTHGDIDFQRLKDYFDGVYASRRDYLLILGDAGIIWSEKENYIFQYSSLGPTVIFIDGNHENFDLLNLFPVVDFLGAKMHRIEEKIYHVLRGEIMIINGTSFLCLGGARSIDKAYRKEHLSWWADEDITQADYQNALINLKTRNNKVDYVLTHCGPSSVVHRLGYERDRDTVLLEKLKEDVKYNHWFFGHYHIDKKINSKFRVFYKDFLVLKSLFEGSKKAKGYVYYDPSWSEDGDSYLRTEKGRKTSLTIDQLPEWYFQGSRGTYYCLRNVKDVAFHMSPFDNHISKDSRIILSYSAPLNKDRNLVMKDDVFDAETWRTGIKKVTQGLEKYSPNLKLNKLKARINLTYDQYNNNLFNLSWPLPFRPFPKVKTPVLKDMKYKIIYKGLIVSNFEDIKTAEQYADFMCGHLAKDHIFRQLIGNEANDYVFAYDVGDSYPDWIFIKKIRKEE